jgi:hypothetical protein
MDDPHPFPLLAAAHALRRVRNQLILFASDNRWRAGEELIKIVWLIIAISR